MKHILCLSLGLALIIALCHAQQVDQDSLINVLKDSSLIFKEQGKITKWKDNRLKIGAILRLRDSDEGLAYYRQTAKDIWWEEGYAEKGRIYYVLGYYAGRYENNFESIRAYEKAAENYRKLPDSVLKRMRFDLGSRILTPLANKYTRLGENEKAIAVFEEALPITLSFGNTDRASQILSDWGLALFDVGKLDEASKVVQRGLNTPKLEPETKGFLLSTKAKIELQRKDLKLADKSISSALAILKDPYYIIGAKEVQAILKVEERKLQEAKKIYSFTIRYAENFYEPSTQNRRIAKLEISLADLLIKMNSPLEAIPLTQSALQRVLPNFHPKAFKDQPNSKYFYAENTILEALTSKALALRASGNPQVAVETMALALEMEAFLRNQFLYSSSKLYLTSISRFRHEKMIEWLMEDKPADYFEKVFFYIEKNRAAVLQQQLISKEGKNQKGELGLLSQELSNSEKRISYLQAELIDIELNKQTKKKSPSWQGFNQQLQIHQLRRDSLLTALKEKYPNWYRNTLPDSFASSQQISSLLSPDKHHLLSYFWGKNSLYICWLGPNNEKAIIEDSCLQSDQIKEYFEWITDPILAESKDGDLQEYRKFITWEQDFYHCLIPDEVKSMIQNGKVNELVVIPDGLLNFLNFDLFLTKSANTKAVDYASLPYLMREVPIRYAYSVPSLIFESMAEANKNRQNYVGFAPAYGQVRNSIMETGSKTIQEISNLINGKTNIGQEASLNNFRDKAPEVKVIQFFGHAEADNQKPQNSWMEFSDGKLFAFEIASMDLAADLAILTGCETGNGRLYSGEGVASLASAFRYSGCENILMTQWQVLDQDAHVIGVDFIKNALEMPMPKALQQAKLSYLDNAKGNPFPFFWGSIQYIGKSTPLPSPNTRFPWIWLLLTISSLGVLAAVWNGWRKKDSGA
ncbi:MAG: CHAT domain-containing protein [Bacteroidia bacterium]|nr:CHAT domain-containing protein [Bacteroidia bacterium]